MKKFLVIIFTMFLLISLSIGVSAASKTYIDSETGVKFTVPDSWTEKALSKDREYIDVKFVSNEASGMSILYGSTDFWSKLPSSDKVGYKRSDFNNSMFTNADIAEMVGTNIFKVKKVTYNGAQCFQAETTTTSNINGLEIDVTMTHIICYDNGWVYWFQFSGDSDNKYFSDFQSMLNTVTFPQTEANSSALGNMIIAALSFAAITGVIVFVIKKQSF